MNKIIVDNTSLFGETNLQLKKQAELLAQKYDIVVTNPPYLNSSYMDNELKKFIEKTYPETKSDLFASFVLQVSNLTKKDGLIGYISPYVWMFISSYEKLREYMIKNMTISGLIQLEYNAFEPACVPVCTFTLRNKFIPEYKGSYVKLSEFTGHQNQAPRTLEAIQNPDSSWFYTASQSDFQKIPGSPIGYWLSEKFINVFETGTKLKELFKPYQGMASSNNLRFLRFWNEISRNNFNDNCPNLKETSLLDIKWYPYNKGGWFRKWYGNYEFVVNWYRNGKEVKLFVDELNKTKPGGRLKNQSEYFKKSITWSALTAGAFGVRYSDKNAIFDVSGSSIFPDEKSKYELIGILNSKVTAEALKVLNPTLNYQVIDVGRIPIYFEPNSNKNELILLMIEISKEDWNVYETSWDFKGNELVKAGSWKSIDRSNTLQEAYKKYYMYWNDQFFQLHQNEEELNRQFIEIYGLQKELTPDEPLEEITILQQELDRKALEKLNKRLQREPGTLKVLNYHEIKLPFDAKEVMSQFVSYAVGCMFGRYSLEKPGLILANQGETLDDYYKLVRSESPLEKGGIKGGFEPDADNVIPILDDEWFEDDITARFKSFLKASFGEENFERNLRFVEECLGKDMQRYFARDFYTDHVRRYKKRPIYWMFSSPQGSFNALIYMHRYTPDTISLMLNNYLRAYQEKLRARRQHLERVQISGTTAEKTQALKETERIDKLLLELHSYERDILYPLATSRISINLDDGVLVNYNKFGKAIKEVTGLNDKPTKKKVREFDWIDIGEIRD